MQRSLQEELLLIENRIDLYYLTGLSLSAGQLFVARDSALLFVDGRYLCAAQKQSQIPVRLLSEQAVQEYIQPYKVLAVDGATTPYERWKQLQEWKALQSSPYPLRKLRLYKDLEEIQALETSAHIAWQGFCHMQTLLQEGITEKELARAFTLFVIEHGADALAFDPIIAFGENSALPHHRSSDTALAPGHVVLLDVGVVWNSYHSDMTRTCFFGTPDPLLVQWQQLVYEAYLAAIDKCRVGTCLQELDKAARQVFQKAGVESYFVHTLGHGVGLEIHEFPRLRSQGEGADLVVEEGMVFTIEPGLYLPHKGGIRYENTIVMTKQGPRSLQKGG